MGIRLEVGKAGMDQCGNIICGKPSGRGANIRKEQEGAEDPWIESYQFMQIFIRRYLD